jgi:H/ACA ribonucleoprotein complex non-core subunit NAF1
VNASTTGASYLPTQNELTEVDITIPRIDEVGTEEKLEKVGQVMTIVDRFAIVRGGMLPSEHLNNNRASDRALDSDTLLVFEDRKVMGYVCVSFHQGLVFFFSDAFPLDPERVRIGREVFHVPSRSRFVFVSQIKAMKGSDASNVHDEEPADEEIEFSDDEAEAAYRRMSKRK